MTGEDLSRMSDARALRYLAERLRSKFANKVEARRLVQIAEFLEAAPLCHSDACLLSRIYNVATSLHSEQTIRINEWLKRLIRTAPDAPSARGPTPSANQTALGIHPHPEQITDQGET